VKRKGALRRKPSATEWAVSGRVHDIDTAATGTTKVPAKEVKELNPATTRVVMVGYTPAQLRTSWYVPYGMAVLFGMLGPLSIALGICGIGGLTYAVIVLRRAMRQTDYQPVWQDWLWYTALPCIAAP